MTEEFNRLVKTHHDVWNNFQQNNQITKEEFFSYMNIVSSTYQIDGQFNQLMIGVWNVDVRELNSSETAGTAPPHEFSNHRASWKHDFHRSLYGNIDHNTFQHPASYDDTRRPASRASVTSEMRAAGVTNTPFTTQITKSNVSCLGDQQVAQAPVSPDDQAMANFRSTLRSRGARGIIGLR